MFIIYHSNQSNAFKKLLINTMSDQSLPDPMQSEIILTEHSIMDQWIQIEIANHFGIACNIKFMTLMSFIQYISNKIEPNNSITNNFSCSSIYWKFMKILSQTQILNQCPIIDKYLHDDANQQKIGQFSEQLSNLFIQYLIYRPDWLNSWESNEIINDLDDTHQSWQSKIWRIFIENIECDHQKLNNNNIHPLQRCINFLKNTQNIICNHLPSRIFIFGITSIPPIYWNILKLLSYHIDIYLWFINPCCHNLIYIPNQDQDTITQQEKQLINQTTASSHSSSFVTAHLFKRNNHDNINHPLLNSWGNVARNTLSLFTQLQDKIELTSFIVPKQNSLLHIIQKNILEFQNHTKNKKKQSNTTTFKNNERHLLTLEDQSITCHVCHSIQREVEVLHDNLLSMMTDDPSLSPGDIIVMAYDIHYYKSAIHSIFDNIQDRHLPFNIATNSYKKNTHPIVSTFIKILNITHSRFTSEEILSFLTITPIASRFNMNKEEVKLLHQWTIESGIRWGLDDITMYNFNLPIINQNTWNFGLNRMLLGYAIKHQHNTWEKFLPYDDITIRDHSNVIGQLGEFLKTLKKWRDRFSHSYPLIEWRSYFKEIIDDFFYCDHLDSDNKKVLLFLKNCYEDVLESGIQAEYNQTISITVLRDKLCQKLTQNIIIPRFIPNVINFCNINPIFCIPYKIVCFLGMNDDKFPRNKITPDFNLMVKNPRKNDDNIYEKDCYSFLMALLLAQERIYISFIGHSMYDIAMNYPSVLVNELFEYIALNFYSKEHENIDININIKHIRQRLCQWHHPFPFSPDNFNSSNNQQSFAKEWLSTININNNHSPLIYPNFNTPLSYHATKTIMFQDLYNFYRHPVRTWFQNRLNVYFDQNTLKLSNDEPFSVDRLNRYKLNIKLIDYLIHNKNIDELYRNVRASGILPYGVFGKLYWTKQQKKMTILANQIKTFHCIEKHSLNISLIFDTTKLIGQLISVQENGLIRWQPRHLSMKDVLLLWIEHIIYCAIGGKGSSRLFGTSNTWHFPNLSRLHAKKLLFTLISDYCSGINTPVLLLHHAGGAWMNHIFDWNTRTISSNPHCQQEARQKLIQIWKGTKYSLFRESHDPYFRKLISFDLSEDTISKITETAEHYFFNAMKYRII
ncbi:exodeoxyribonuclease V subunit gamma [Blochmannia endosymbiont of Camponotus sp. C-003]|uniref:exodeoxyribonuclease V subunit gamma n=1 Tax=Blochmannia endosymbiont of Camponotus sp. C-003 TaxID=2945588 RepID=UPI0024DFF8D2|nr:exodeoxyribonuclease V subunit gamma [Blochmannia endosymbiont of Camponotus sp. C-003]